MGSAQINGISGHLIILGFLGALDQKKTGSGSELVYGKLFINITSLGSKKVLFVNENSPKMGKWAKKAVKTDIWQWVVDEVKNHLEPLFGTRLEV